MLSCLGLHGGVEICAHHGSVFILQLGASPLCSFSPSQAEDEWSSLLLGTQKTMAFFYLHIRIVTGLSLDVLVLKLIPRKREEMDYTVTDPFN